MGRCGRWKWGEAAKGTMAALSSSSSEVEGHEVIFFTLAPKGIPASLFTIEGAKNLRQR